MARECKSGTVPVLERASSDFRSRIQFAQRADGQWFTRFQFRDPRYGYKWGSWRRTIDPTDDDRPPRRNQYGGCARLPKD